MNPFKWLGRGAWILLGLLPLAIYEILKVQSLRKQAASGKAEIRKLDEEAKAAVAKKKRLATSGKALEKRVADIERTATARMDRVESQGLTKFYLNKGVRVDGKRQGTRKRKKKAASNVRTRTKRRI